MSIPVMNEGVLEEGGIFVPDEIATELNMLIRDASCTERFARHIPMKRKTMNRRKQADGAHGYWVDAMAVKPKDTLSFEPYTLTAEKMAVIIPLEDQFLEDADTDAAAVVREDVVKVFSEDLDRTYLGYEPSTPFADSVSGNVPLDHIIAYGSDIDIVGDMSEAMSTVESHGFEITGMITHPRAKHWLRNLRDMMGNPIYAETLIGGIRSYSVWGIPTCFTRQVATSGSPLGFEILMAFWPYVMIGDRVGLQIAKSTEATLTQGSDEPVNLFERDLTAYRFVTRKGFVVKDDEALAKITGVPWDMTYVPPDFGGGN